MDTHEKTVLVFDLDGTLTPSKQAITDEMAALFVEALTRYHICVISGGSFRRFETQLLAALPQDSPYERLMIMPTCGTQRYAFVDGSWQCVYIDELHADAKQRIKSALWDGIRHFGYDTVEARGELVEDRGSQITYSALGQDIADVLGEAGLRQKAEWDPDDHKKQQLRDHVAAQLPDYEVRISSPTSIDVSNPGMDKAYGVRELMRLLHVSKDEVVFFGDRLEEGGNDYPVKAMGVDCVAVTNWQGTADALRRILEENERGTI